jgi:hypothetical protein
MHASLNRFLVAHTIVMLPLLASSATMDDEIDALLDAVATSECVFVRNGKEYDVDDAVSHLQMKRERGGRYFDSTEEFIERIASKSSWSGKPYEIHCGADEPQLAFDWFNDRLQEIREE